MIPVPRTNEISSGSSADALCNVYVASLPLEFDDQGLNDLFAPYGSISSARIMRAKGTRRSKGYGFVLYRDSASAVRAIGALHGHVLQGSRIQVRLANPDASNAFENSPSAALNTPPLSQVNPSVRPPALQTAALSLPASFAADSVTVAPAGAMSLQPSSFANTSHTQSTSFAAPSPLFNVPNALGSTATFLASASSMPGGSVPVAMHSFPSGDYYTLAVQNPGMSSMMGPTIVTPALSHAHHNAQPHPNHEHHHHLHQQHFVHAQSQFFPAGILPSAGTSASHPQVQSSQQPVYVMLLPQGPVQGMPQYDV